MKYIKQLDSLRGIAVLLVIITHWFPEGHPLHDYTAFFNGVDIFFVLSGFLITRILLENRNEAENAATGKWFVAKNFYIRRFLRIFPVYYGLIIVMFLLGPKTSTHIRENVGYFLTYTSNFYFIQKGKWEGVLSHLWSLSVEEQFYLLWPWLMLFLRKRILFPVIVVSIVTGVLGQYYFSPLATFSCFDGFGIGALLAWAVVYKPESLKSTYVPALCVAAACCLLQVARVFSDSQFVPLPSRTLTAFCTAAVILGVLLGKAQSSIFSRAVLKNSALQFIGKISYGVYLYHLMVAYCLSKIFSSVNLRLFPISATFNSYLINVENFCLLIAVSYISWRFIEQPILQLKRNYAYQKTGAPATGRVYMAQPVSPATKLK